MHVDVRDVACTVAEFGFLSALLTNTLLIYLTARHTQNINGTYKHMIILFAILGLSFSCTEMLARPFVHNYNGSFIYFSLAKGISEWKPAVMTLLVVYSGVYSALISFVAVQFIYRWLTLVNQQRLELLFNGWKIAIWLVYIASFGLIWGALVYFCGLPDKLSNDYIRRELDDVYGMRVESLAVFIIVAYDADSKVRWSSVLFLFGTCSILVIQYAVMVFCGTSMHLQMTEKLKHFSVTHQRLQRQLFKVLVLQITVPTVLFHMPIFPVLTAPFLNAHVSFQSGVIYSLFSLYPPIDGLIIMCVVSDYRNAMSKLLGRPVSGASVSTVRTAVESRLY